MKSGNGLNDETLFGTLGSDNELEAEADEVFGKKKDERYALSNCHAIVYFFLTCLLSPPLTMYCFDPISVFKTSLNIPLWMWTLKEKVMTTKKRIQARAMTTKKWTPVMIATVLRHPNG